jgi:alpha 1,2-mannosyltransferase
MSTFESNGFRTIGFGLQQSAIKELRKQWKEFVRDIEPCPGTFSGKGVVICGGGLRYFTCAWVTIRMLRNKGCTLPIELWCMGNELSGEVRKEVGRWDVTVRDFLDHGATSLSGCMLKPLSIIKSSFKEVIFIDADNVCVGDPEALFDTGAYKNYGAIFWPDYWQTTPENPIWSITGTSYTDTKEQESGQIVVDKSRCWKELNLCLHFNQLSNIYHMLLLGDKDTFRFAWMALRTPFFTVSPEPAVCGYRGAGSEFTGTTIVQYDLDGKPFFLHRNLLKWDVTKKNEMVWSEIKRFVPGAEKKRYLFKYSQNGHYYMDLEGDVETMAFDDIFPGLEDLCMEYLEELRSSSLYQRFLTHSHFARHRYPLGPLFSLEG